MIKLYSTKKRSLRLQKKLRVQTYQYMYVSWEIEFCDAESQEFQRSDSISDILEWFGSFCFVTGSRTASGGCVYLAKYGPDIPREIAIKLSALPGVVSVKVSTAVDANYDSIWDTHDIDSDLFSRNGTITIP